jgi:hypothetical protein
LIASLVLGPVVVMVTVTVVAAAPAAICVGLKAQLTVASGRPLQAKVTASVNVPPPGVTLKVEVVDSPESTGVGVGVVGVDKVKVGATTCTVAGVAVVDGWL